MSGFSVDLRDLSVRFGATVALDGIALVREGGDLPDVRVGEVLSYGAAMRPTWSGEVAERLQARFDLPPRKRVEHLSRGQRSALAALVGIASRAPLLLAMGVGVIPALVAFAARAGGHQVEGPESAWFFAVQQAPGIFALVIAAMTIAHLAPPRLRDDAPQLRVRGDPDGAGGRGRVRAARPHRLRAGRGSLPRVRLDARAAGLARPGRAGVGPAERRLGNGRRPHGRHLVPVRRLRRRLGAAVHGGLSDRRAYGSSAPRRSGSQRWRCWWGSSWC